MILNVNRIERESDSLVLLIFVTNFWNNAEKSALMHLYMIGYAGQPIGRVLFVERRLKMPIFCNHSLKLKFYANFEPVVIIFAKWHRIIYILVIWEKNFTASMECKKTSSII